MKREFDRNMFIMLFSIMIGIILITFFIADIVNKTKLDELSTEHQVEIDTIQSKNENFTSNFIRSNVVLDQAREERAFGNYHFKLSYIWYQSVLNEKKIDNFILYKERALDNCTGAMPRYENSYGDFIKANEFFNTTKSYTTNLKYQEVIDLYLGLTLSGSKLMKLSISATENLSYLLQKIIFDEENETVTYTENVTDILESLNETLLLIEEIEENEYGYYQSAIDEYEFFDEIR